MNGQVKKLLLDKMFGFIRDIEGGKEYFFHAQDTDCWSRLELGNTVTFEPVITPKGLRASNVRLVE